MGQLGRGASVKKTVSLTTDTSAYAEDDVIDEPQELSGAFLGSGGAGILNSILVKGQTGTAADMKLYFFKDDPGDVGDDNTAFTPSAAAIANLVGVHLTDNSTNGAPTGGTNWSISEGSISKLVEAADEKDSLWVVVVAGGAITFTGADDLAVDVDILQL